MAKKERVGFFKRLLGFGRKKKKQPEEVLETVEATPEAVDEATPRAAEPVEEAPPPAPAPEPAPVAEQPAKPQKPATPKPAARAKDAAKPVEVKEKAKAKPAKPVTKAEPKPVVKPTEAKQKPTAKPEPEPKLAKPALPEPKPAPQPEPVKARAPKPARPTRPEPKPTPKPEPVTAPAPEPAKPAPKPPPAKAAAPPPAEPELKPAPKPEPVKAPAPEPAKPVEPKPEPVAKKPEAKPAKKKGWFARLKDGLTKSSNALTQNIAKVLTKRKLDGETLQDLEDILIQADLGVDTALAITEALAKDRFDKEISSEEVRAFLAAEVEAVLEPVAKPLEIDSRHKPFIILVVGVNGTGKTTTIGKLAAQFRADGHKVLLAAGDTFRAAAIDQLKIWGERAGADVIAHNIGADAAGLAYDAINQAREQGHSVVMIDTAGRLQNKADLMAELEKVVRVVNKRDETAPHAVLLVLDATTGQNALNQVEIFKNVAGVTGLIVTKLDGTARGGILVAISEKYQIPVHAIGVGETLDDMQPFDATEFAAAIVGTGLDQDEAA
jgi:fused signal recognition particle receptor